MTIEIQKGGQLFFTFLKSMRYPYDGAVVSNKYTELELVL